jgi:hypothetical protein
MMNRNPKTWALLPAVLFLAAGCAVENLPDPALFDVCLRSDGPCVNQAYAGERTNLALIGAYFHPAFEVDINDDDPPPLRGDFRATIAGTPLEDVWRHSEFLLMGTMPGTVPLGTHDVLVELPGGLRTGLPEAFSIVDPLVVSATPEQPRVPNNHVFGLDVTLENLASVPLTQVTLSLSQQGTGRVILPADSVAASVGGESSSTTTLRLQAQQPGPTTLLLSASALAGGNVLVGTSEPLMVDLLVLPPAVLLASAEVSPTTVDPGDDFELIIDVFNTGGVDALDVEVLEPTVSGSGSAALGDPAPSRLEVPAGSRRTIRFSGRAVSSGTVVFDTRLQGLEAVSRRLLGPVAADPVSIEIR